MGRSIKGNPAVDAHAVRATDDLVHFLKKNARGLDAKTLVHVESQLGQAVYRLKPFQHARSQQKTALPGGRRRRARAGGRPR